MLSTPTAGQRIFAAAAFSGGLDPLESGSAARIGRPAEQHGRNQNKMAFA